MADQIEEWGIRFPVGVSELDSCFYRYAHDKRPVEKGGPTDDDRWEVFVRIVDLLWNCEESSRRVVWNDWTDRMLRAMIEYRYVGLAGCGSCVDGDTRIELSDGTKVAIRDLVEAGERPEVLTLNGPVLAEVPYLKGQSRLFEFKLSDGSSFKCTSGHRLLSNQGWRTAHETNAGDLLHGFSLSPQLTSSGNDQQGQQQDAPRWKRITEDSQFGCHFFDHSGDAQLQWARDSAQLHAPSPDDAVGRSECASLLEGVPLSESEHSRHDQLSNPSKSSVEPQYSQSQSHTSSRPHSSPGTSSPLAQPSQPCAQSPRENNPPSTCVGQDQRSGHILNKGYGGVLSLGSESPSSSEHIERTSVESPSYPPLDECYCIPQTDPLFSGIDHQTPFLLSSSTWKVAGVAVESITDIGIHDYYDIQVPGEEHYFAEGAIHHNSGKSDAAAAFAIVEWLAAPTETLCLITSTTIEGAKKRVWKSVTEFWNSLEAQWKREGKTLPGKMLSSGNNAQIQGIDINGKFSAALGLSIVAADTSADQAASKKLKGLKAPAEGRGRLRLIADEMPDLGRSVYVSAVGNLNSNPDFKCIALGNPRYKMDPFGEFCEPSRSGGYNSVSAIDDHWETSIGVCIRFDATRSPRLIEKDGDKKYAWQPGDGYISQIADKFGEDSAEYWSQVRGMWPPDGMDNSIWSEGELLQAEIDHIDNWDNPNDVIKVSALDIPYTSGGDRAVFMWGECGKYKGKKHLRILGKRTLSEGITEDTFKDAKDDSGRAMSSNLHLIQQYKTLNKEMGILPRRTGFDATAGGKIFGGWITAEWAPGCRAINFGGSPEERIAEYDEKPEDYGNRVAQLWCQPKSLVRERQIVGIPRTVAMELCQRKFSTKSTSGKLWIETKDEMKKRTGESPDEADSFVILIEVAILNGLLEFEEVKKVEKKEMKVWKDFSTRQKYNNGEKYLGNATPKHLTFR